MQLDLFADNEALIEDKQKKQNELTKERKMQKAMLSIKKKFGKNAILKGLDFDEGATTKERNNQIGGHKA
jgi:DNA polymerase V